MTRDANAAFAVRIADRTTAEEILTRIPSPDRWEIINPKDWRGVLLVDRDSMTSTMRKDLLELAEDHTRVRELASVGLSGSWFVWCS